MQTTSAIARPTGMRAFLVVWLGQVVSLTGSAMTRFALTIWAYQLTGQATTLALVSFFTFTPMVILSPLAGVLVDRFNRKLMMMLSDLGTGIATIGLFLLYTSGHLEIWHIYLAATLSGASEVFQWPAYSAAISSMLKPAQYGRAQGLITLADNGATMIAPILASLLISVIGIGGIMLIDILTFTAAISSLLFVRIPQPTVADRLATQQANFWLELSFGIRYIFQRPSLLGMQLIFMGGNIAGFALNALVAPYILARTQQNEVVLAITQSALAIGGVLGGLLVATQGGTKRRVQGVVAGFILSGLASGVIVGVTQLTWVWMLAMLLNGVFVANLNAANQALWQSKVPAELQGRVFSARRLIAWLTIPLALGVAGPLADRLFEPALQPNGSLAGILGWLVGTGSGAGIGLLMVLLGAWQILYPVALYQFRAVREAETILPDAKVADAQPTEATHPA